MATATNIRERTFQEAVDTVLKPNGVKVGGYPEDIFINLKQEEVDKWTCNICYLVAKDIRKCSNKHLFCHTCIFAWTLTFGENSEKCPVCRIDQKTYSKAVEENNSVLDKRVSCPESDCGFRAPLKIFLMHTHGKEKFSNEHIKDLEELRPPRTTHRGGMIVISPNGTGQQRLLSFREQIERGRYVLQQMMLLLHVENRLREQATLHHGINSSQRTRQIDEVLALNEQLSEVHNMLSALTALSENRNGLILRGQSPVQSAYRSPTAESDSLSSSSESTVADCENPVPAVNNTNNTRQPPSNPSLPRINNSSLVSGSTERRIPTYEFRDMATSETAPNSSRTPSTQPTQPSSNETEVQQRNSTTRRPYPPPRRINRPNGISTENTNSLNNRNQAPVPMERRGPTTPGQLLRARKRSTQRQNRS